jgi:PhzF family phenazine biosynthesis protein
MFAMPPPGSQRNNSKWRPAMSPPPQPVVQVDVFTTTPYAGAPAAVCISSTAPDETWMARVSREMACPNTAFAQPRTDRDGYDLRWFTAGGNEVALCGHATLATAHVLFETGQITEGAPALFHTQSGKLTALRQPDGSIEMSFPLEIAKPLNEVPPALTTGLGTDLIWVGRNRLDYVVEVGSEEALRALKPNLSILAEIETRGFVVTARAARPEQDGYDYVLRFFGPRVGVAEDMVTGTAHCALGPYWRDKLPGKSRFVAFQASPRGGFVNVRLDGDRVLISGSAVTVLRGQLLA